MCHNGINIGGNLYNKFGVYEDYHSTNFGRYKIIRRQDDRFVFKVPTLRTIELTAPYMHDGKTKILKKAVDIMAKYQIGRYIAIEEVDAIVEFLKSLTGEIPDIVKSRQ